jgi:predicted XRE-type DNA-binding protein
MSGNGDRVTGETEDLPSALAQLGEALGEGEARIRQAIEQRESLLQQRTDGRSWVDLTLAEDPPGLNGLLNETLQLLIQANSRYRRAMAQTLHREGLTMQRIAELFGVTRQRVSHLLRSEADHSGTSALLEQEGRRG